MPFKLPSPLLAVVVTSATCLTLPTPALANKSSATIVYDVKLKEFLCWHEGALTDDVRRNPCDYSNVDYGWHPMTGNLYFVRAEAVSVLLVNAVAVDLFSLDVKVDDLAEPTVPVTGSLTELPKLLPIPPAPTVIAGNKVAFSATTPSIRPEDALIRLLTTTADKDFKSWVQGKLIDPLNPKEVSDLISQDVTGALQQLSTAPTFIAEVATLQTDLKNIQEPATAGEIVDRTRALARLLEREAGLRSRLTATGIVTGGKTINDALVALRSAAVQRATSTDNTNFQNLTSDIEQALPPEHRYSRIDAIIQDGKDFKIDPSYKDSGDFSDFSEFLRKIGSVAPKPLTKDLLTTLKKNLIVLSDMWSDILNAQLRRDVLETVQGKVDAENKSNSGVFELQKQLVALTDGTIQKAVTLNAKARSLPLDDFLRLLPVGQWFTSKTITVTLKQGQRVALFDVGGVSDATRTSVTGGDNPAAKQTQITATDLTAARTLQFPIYNLYHFQIGLGFVYSTAEDKRFAVDTVTLPSGATEKFIDQTRSRDYNLLGTVNVIIFPWARHAFPWRARYVATSTTVPGLARTEKRPHFYNDIGPMFGFSITSPNRDFLIGGAWFPRPSPVGLQLGWHLALRDYPPSGIDITQPIADRVARLQQRRINGFFVGLVFTTDFFGKVFAPIFKP
jgi:hypothetical protein